MLKVYGFSRVNKAARQYAGPARAVGARRDGPAVRDRRYGSPYHDLDREEFRMKNPFGQIPVIDDDGVVVTESGAILLYLARKSGKLMPHDLAGEAQVLRWSVAALSSVEVPVLTMWFVGISGGKGSKPYEALQQWSDMRLKQLDGWLANRTFVATDEFTVADVLMAHVLSAGADQALLKPYEHVRRYLARCMDRPAWKRTLDAYCARVASG